MPHVPISTFPPRRPAFGAARRTPDDAGAALPSPELTRLLAQLRASVARHVAERCAAGASLDRIVLEVRCLVREAESCEGWRDPSDALLAQVLRWGVEAYDEAYYGQPELQHVPRFY